jgi:diguanylate cyclase (GGDEF)-like protein/PAS domain S-box-containing protein
MFRIRVVARAFSRSDKQTKSVLFLNTASNQDLSEELAKTKAHLEAVFESSHQAYFLLDTDLKIHSANKLGKNLISQFHDHQMIEGDNFLDYIPHSLKNLYKHYLTLALAGQVSQIEVSMQEYGLGQNWYMLDFRPILSTDEVTGVCINIANISRHKQIEQELINFQERFEALVQNSSDVISVLDETGIITYVSPSVNRILGWEAKEIIGQNGFDFIHPQDLERLLKIFAQAGQTPYQSVRFEYRFRSKDNSYVDLEGVGYNLLQENRVHGMVVNSRGISELKKTSRELAKSQQLLERITNQSPNLIFLENIQEGKIVYINDALQTITGYKKQFWMSQNYSISKLVDPQDQDVYAAFLERSLHLKDGETSKIELGLKTKNGQAKRVELQYSVFERDENDQAKLILGTINDITLRKQMEEELLHKASFDSLTHLPNRSFFMSRLEESIQKSQKNPDYRFAVLFLDLDRFKIINDSLGHNNGDKLLVHISKRLVRCVQDQGMVARLGGDEFTILMENVKDLKEVRKVTENIEKLLKKPFNLHHNKVHITGSIGIAYSTGNYHTAIEILRDADTAMYKAKEKGRNCYEIFNKNMYRNMISFLKMETEIRRGLEKKEFVAWYQPIADLKSGKTVACEALIRWQHPQKGILLPRDFLGVAEETGLIAQLDKIVLREAVRQNKLWQKAGLDPIIVCVNMSMPQFKQNDFVKKVQKILHQYQLEPQYLDLELTEKTAIENMEESINVIRELRNLGVQISIDDFGTGYSSLTYLRQLPIDMVKIDRSFVREIHTSQDAAGVCQSVIGLVQNLRFKTIAEGVENQLQLEILKSQNCNYGQGFYFSQAMPEKEFRKFLKKTDNSD